MTSEPSPLRRRLRTIHPARLRFRLFLRKYKLNPDTLPQPLAGISDRDFFIAGCPRTGSSLAAAALHQPPHVVTSVEPWDGLRLPPAELFRSFRQEIDTHGTITRSTLAYEPLLTNGKVVRVPEGSTRADVTVSPNYQLGIKWPAFYRYLPLMPDARFVICLRHPFEVLSSFKAQGGSLHEGMEYPAEFNRTINQAVRRRTSDWAERRIALFDEAHERIIPYLSRPNVYVLRYERWFTEHGKLMDELSAFLGVRLGAGPAKIATPKSSDGGNTLTPKEREAIRRTSTTAGRLGYDISG